MLADSIHRCCDQAWMVVPNAYFLLVFVVESVVARHESLPPLAGLLAAWVASDEAFPAWLNTPHVVFLNPYTELPSTAMTPHW